MENDNTPVHHEEEGRQVNVWTPEDAARFLTSAIQEAQRPLTDALKQRSVSPGMFALVITILVAVAALCGWVLIDRLEKSDKSAESARADRDVAMDKRYEAQSKQEALTAKLTAIQEQATQKQRELSNENERLRTEAMGLKASDEEQKNLRTDLNRYRRQNDLLRTQISGLEMEKQALARQLAAVKAMAVSDEEDSVALPVTPGSPSIEDAMNTTTTPATTTPAPDNAPAESTEKTSESSSKTVEALTPALEPKSNETVKENEEVNSTLNDSGVIETK